jgi:hypothetical protein
MRTTKRQQLLTKILALNLLTPQVLKSAATEIQLGKHVQLDWAMHHLDYPGFGRLQYEHRIKDLREKGFVGFDDELTINTQTSSQWDGLKHVSDTSLASSFIIVIVALIANHLRSDWEEYRSCSLDCKSKPSFTTVQHRKKPEILL